MNIRACVCVCVRARARNIASPIYMLYPKKTPSKLSCWINWIDNSFLL